MADIIKPDLCVIGAGALGLELARRAARRGLEVVLVARPGPEPGDAPQGRLRRAALLASAARAQALRTAGDLGLDNEAPKPNFRAIATHASAMAAAGASRDTQERLAALGIRVLTGKPAFTSKRQLALGPDMIRARHFVLATGADPIVPALPGLDQVPFFTPDTIEDNIRKLTHLVVIGGTPEAFELAQAYRRMGAEVTLVPQGGLLPGFDPELVALLLRALREEGLEIIEDGEVSAILPRSQGIGIALSRPEEQANLDASHILLAMGRRPALDAALLEKAGPRNRRISVLGGTDGARRGAMLIERLAGHGGWRRPTPLAPLFVATEPALAQAGPLDKTLRKGEMLWRANLAESDGIRAAGGGGGLLKLAADRKGHILAAGAIGPGAGALIALLALTMERGGSLGELEHLILPPSDPAASLLDIAGQFAASRKLRRPFWRGK